MLSSYKKVNNYFIGQSTAWAQKNLRMLKTYIKTNFANGFIKLFKLPASTSIFFVQKPDDSFQLYIDYWDFNNLTIKN